MWRSGTARGSIDAGRPSFGVHPIVWNGIARHYVRHSRRALARTLRAWKERGVTASASAAAASATTEADLLNEEAEFATATSFRQLQLLRRCFANSLLTSLRQKRQSTPQPCKSTPWQYCGVKWLADSAAPEAWHALAADVAAGMTACNQREGVQAVLQPHLWTELLPPPAVPAGAAGDARCCLLASPSCQRFRHPAVGAWLQQLFHLVQDSTANREGLAQVHLGQYDLFHAHVFMTWPVPNQQVVAGERKQAASTWTKLDILEFDQEHQHEQQYAQQKGSIWVSCASSCSNSSCNTCSGTHGSRNNTVSRRMTEANSAQQHARLPHLSPGQHHAQGHTSWEKAGQGHVSQMQKPQLGVLFHAKEYPRFCPDTFPYHLGYCQTGSHVDASMALSMDQRNILWIEGSLYVLDLEPEGVLYSQLLWPGQQPLRTVHENDLGLRLFDVTYLPSWGDVLVSGA